MNKLRKTNKMVCLDMDGTIADLFGTPDWLDRLRNFDPSVYSEAKPLCDMELLGEVLASLIYNGWGVSIISWGSMVSPADFTKATRKAKKDWLKKYRLPLTSVHIVKYGTPKAACIRNELEKGGYAILVDDSPENYNRWKLGDTIDPRRCDLVEALAALLD